jgi:hypothetical protein
VTPVSNEISGMEMLAPIGTLKMGYVNLLKTIWRFQPLSDDDAISLQERPSQQKPCSLHNRRAQQLSENPSFDSTSHAQDLFRNVGSLQREVKLQCEFCCNVSEVHRRFGGTYSRHL